MKIQVAPRFYIMLMLAMFIWGLSFVWYKLAYVSFGPATVIIMRLFLSCLVLFIIAWSFRQFRLPDKKDFKYFFLLALFEPFLYFIGESYGMKYISATLASVIISIIPLVTSFADKIFYKSKLHLANYAGILISFMGVVLVVYSDGKLGDAPWYGIALLLLAVLSTVGYTLILKRLAASYNSITIISVQNLIGGLYFIPVFLITEVRHILWSEITFRSLVPVIYLGIFASSLAFMFFVEGIRKIGITRSVVFTNFIPVVTVTFSVIILSEKVTILKIAGTVIVVAGLMLAQLKALKKI